ncbi:MAG: HYR domain-containing protein [Saprospiraceae bacterium]
MQNGNVLRANQLLAAGYKSQRGLIVLALTFLFSFFHTYRSEALTCEFNSLILASTKPFNNCHVGTDTIIIRDSFVIDVFYEPIIGGVPFEGLLLVDGGVLQWASNVALKLGANARVVLINGGLFRPISSNAPDCNRFRALFFDNVKTVDCDGSTAPHAFSDVNAAGCVTVLGICCNASIVAAETSGAPNDLTLCQPGDTVRLSVVASGLLNYSIFWSPNIGPGVGPYPATPVTNTNYAVSLTAIFDPYGPEPPYLLSCNNSVTVKINPQITVSATTTPVPCLNVPTGGISLTVSGGTPGYTYLWSNNATTKNLVNVPGGTYTVTVSDKKGCGKVFTVTIPVVDNVPPTLSCPGNATGVANPGVCTTLIPNINAVFTDNCPTVNVTYTLSGATTGSGIGQLSNTVPFSSGVTTATYSVNDGANTVSCNFTVTVSDTQLPTASNPTPLSGISCLANVPAPNPAVVTTEADNCGTTTVVHAGDAVASGSGCPGDTLIVLRSYRVSDLAGNSITVTQTIRVVDNVAPAFIFVPANVVANCQSIPVVGTPTAADNCGGSVAMAYNGETRTDGACPDSYSLRRRWTATDGCGNTATAEQIITVQDVTPPVFTTVPPPVTVSCNALPAVGTPVATDNCDMSATITYTGQTRTDGACSDSYTLRRRWTAADNCGNTASAEQIIVVQDFTKPTFTFVPANVTVTCNGIPAVDTPTATDDCDNGVSIAYNGQNRTDGACPDSYTLVRRWTVTDNCGNTNSAEQTIAVQDVVPPVFTAFPGDATVSCDAIPATGSPSASDNCAPTTTILYLGETRNNGVCPDNYTLLRRWRATDACGNSVVGTQTITVRDQTAPLFSFVPANTTINCDAIPPVGTPVAADNCASMANINYDGQTKTDGPCPGNYSLARRWTAVDNCGNTRTAEQILTVRDLTAPVFTSIPANVTVSCNAIPAAGTPSASDNCDATVTLILNGDTRVNGACTDSYTLKRQWTASDDCGNTATGEQLIFVQDVTKPAFTFVPADATVNCEEIPSMGTPTATDNCDNSVTITFAGVTQTNGNCASGGTVTRRWIATDNCGNTAIAEQMLTVQDTTKPVFTLVPANTTVSCDAIPVPGTPTATDNCSADVEMNFSGDVRINGSCPDSYALKRTWTATDLCGNTATAEQTIVVRDLVAPVFSFVPANATVSCSNVPAVGTPTATDNCDNSVGIVYDGETRTNGSCPDAYTLVRRWRAADNCGNTKTASQTILVQDVTKPTFVSFPADATVQCDNLPAIATPTASDNCDASVNIAYNGESRTDGACSNTYLLKRVWTITDNCSNTATAVQNITVLDQIKPAFTTVPADATVSCSAVPAVGTPTATDNCTASVTVSFNGQTQVDGACPNTYVLKRQWTAADACGNTETAVQTISVQDVQRPVFTVSPPDVTVECSNVPAVAAPVATDNCTANVTIVYDGESRTNGSCPDTYVLLRKWTAADACGNTETADQVITVRDLTRPAFTAVPANVTVDCSTIPAVDTPTASDNCDNAVAIIYDGETRTNGTCPDTYTLKRRWTATDNCGNSEQAEQIIAVRDVVVPVFTSVPANATVDCDAVPAAGSPAASDNCDNSVAIVYDGETRTDGACPNAYTLLRKWTATDNCGNTATAVQEIAIRDVTKPAFVFFPADVTVECSAVPAVQTPTATDNCTASVTVSFNGENRTDGACANTFVLTRKWTIADNCANTMAAVQTITVGDITKPVFTFVPANVTVSCEAVPAVGSPIASDNCAASVTISFDGESRVDGFCTDTYVLLRKWTASDACGNTVSATQSITVQDVKRPVFTFSPPNVTVDCANVPVVAVPTAIDNCAATVLIEYLGETRTDGACPDTYVLLRKWKASDFCGNTEQISQAITVRDVVKPAFTAVPANLTVDCSAVPAVGVPAATDNCDGTVSIVYAGETRADGPCPDTYILLRKWTATDNCGNTELAQQSITVRDLVVPVFTFVPADATVSCDAVSAVGSPTATDNCDGTVSIVFLGETRTDGPCLNTYSLLRRWSAKDNCGNESLAAQTIVVQDAVAPVFTSAPADLTVDCQAVPAVDTPTATDNCTANVAVTYLGEQRTNGACPDSYTLVRRWTAADQCGNSVSKEQKITVQDVARPAFTFVPMNLTVTCQSVPAVGQPLATDNCAASPTVVFNGETRLDGACPDTYTLERRWTVTDNCGNTATALQTIAVQDVASPVFTFVPADATVNCEAIPAISMPTATDNCDASVTITLKSELQTGTDCSSGGVLIRRWTAVDNCGNSAVAEQYLTVQDTTKPVFTFVPANLTVSCAAVPVVGDPTATDNCSSSVSIVFEGEDRQNGACPDTYIIRRRWTATDICGNERTAQQIVTVRDVEAPVFSFVPAHVSVACESVPSVVAPEAKDNCDTDVSIVYNGETRTDGPCPDTYVLLRKWTATDNCGNSATATQVVSVRDQVLPVFSFVPPSSTTTCASVPPVVHATATDNCDASVLVTFNGEFRANGPCPDTYVLTRRWTAADNCGNTVSAEQVITVQDIVKPVFTSVPANATVSCDAVPGVGTPTATDNCTTAVTIIYEGETRTDGPCPDTYVLVRRWRATDDCGNATPTEQILAVRDVAAPVFTFVPADAVVACNAVPAPATPTASDNCDSGVQVVYNGETILGNSVSGTYQIQRRWTANDNCNNTALIVQTLTVKDTVAPTITCPANISEPANGATCMAVVTFAAPVVSDNCTASPALVGNATSGAAFPIGTTPVVFSATDASGNVASCNFTITVADTTHPVLTNCPNDFTVTTPNGACSMTVIWDAPNVTDACDSYPIVPQPNVQPFTVFPTGLTTVVYTAQDSSGNTLTCSFVVTVQENVPPLLVSNCPPDITVNTGNCTALATWTPPVFSDNCGAITVSSNHKPGDVFPETTTQVVYTASDTWGNTTTCSFNVTVVDTIAPTFSGCPADTIVSSGTDCSVAANWLMPMATDNCSASPTVTAYPMPGAQYPVGHTFVKVLVTDLSGNKDECIFKVTVLGPPLGFVGAPLDQSFSGVCSAVATWTPPTPTGVCAPATVVSNYQPGDTFPVGETVVIYTVSDTLGYTSTVSFSITVTESVAPVFVCPPSPVVVDVSGGVLSDPGQFVVDAKAVATCDGATIEFDLPTATDNCTTPVVAQDSGPASGKFFAVGTHVLTFSTADDAGNTAACSVEVQVVPLSPLAPQVSDKIGCAGDDIVLSTPVIPGATYYWNGPKPPYANSNNLLIEGLTLGLTGIYTVQASVNGCLTPLDSALVRIGKQPDAVDDLDFEVETGGLLPIINVLTNDKYETDDYVLTLLTTLPGLSQNSDGTFAYQAGPANGHVNFIYKLCSEACPDLCDEGVVTITVRETFCTYIPNVITPNEDGINDYLEIPCLNSELYPNNSLIIYNQWGDKVYEATPYENTPDKAWRGTLRGVPGQNLPDGTYFYFFRPDPDKPALNGFVEIFR